MRMGKKIGSPYWYIETPNELQWLFTVAATCDQGAPWPLPVGDPRFAYMNTIDVSDHDVITLARRVITTTV